MRMLRFLLVAATLVPWLSACPAPAAAKQARKITYDEHIVPILREKCFACHSQDRKKGGLQLHTYPAVMAGGGSGEVVKPGDPNNSRLYQLVTHQQRPHMPPKSPMLPKDSLETIRQWIEGGALENSGSKAVIVNKPKVDFTLSSVAKGKPAGPPPMPGKLSLEPIVHTARTTAITALASSPWAPLMAVAGQQQVLLYHSDTLELLGVLPFPEGIPHVLRFSRNGSLLLAGGGRGGKSGRVVVWSVKTGQRIFEVGEEYDAVLAADISADQSQIALGGPSKVVRVYSTRDGKLLREIRKHTDWIFSLEYSPDGVLLATADRNGGLFVWEANTGREFYSLRGHTAAITALSWRADSNVLASASEDGTIRLWEMENGNPIKTWQAHGGGVEWVTYTHDGRLVSCGRDQTARVWDGNGAPQRALEAFADIALRTTFSHDGQRVIAGDWTGQIRVWNTADGKRLGELSSNPPTLAERLAAAQKDVAARQADHDRLTAAAAASEAAAKKAAAELAAAEKLVAVRAQAAKTVAAKAAADKQAATQAAAGLATAHALVKKWRDLLQAAKSAQPKVAAKASH